MLEAGADPNDDQTIYNRHFRPANDYLELLLAHGLGQARRGPWPQRLGDHLTPPKLLLQDALVFVAGDDRYADRVALLLGHGVDPDGRGTRHPMLRGQRPVERAHLAGAQKILELLVAAGATPPVTDTVDTFLSLALRGEREAVERELRRDPAIADAAIQRRPRALIDAAGSGNANGVELLARVGYDVNLLCDGQGALHVAAYEGNRELCELLIRLGGDPTIRDSPFDAPAAGWAEHAHHDELAIWMRETEPGGPAG